jgi:uncharacterized protein (TIGR02266 family)
MAKAEREQRMTTSSEHERQAHEVSIRALSEDPDAQNRRQHSRFAVELDVSISSDHNFYAGFTENLSAGGIFVATHVLKPVGSVIELCVFLPDSQRTVRGKGEVRWVRSYNEHNNVPPGMGISFIELEAGCEHAIAEFLSNREPLFYDD